MYKSGFHRSRHKVGQGNGTRTGPAQSHWLRVHNRASLLRRFPAGETLPPKRTRAAHRIGQRETCASSSVCFNQIKTRFQQSPWIYSIDFSPDWHTSVWACTNSTWLIRRSVKFWSDCVLSLIAVCSGSTSGTCWKYCTRRGTCSKRNQTFDTPPRHCQRRSPSWETCMANWTIC